MLITPTIAKVKSTCPDLATADLDDEFAAGSAFSRNVLNISSCAKKFASAGYERAAGISGQPCIAIAGSSNLILKAVWISTKRFGFLSCEQNTATLAHEWGHTYGLCDEYAWDTYQAQSGLRTCVNDWPANCAKNASIPCPGSNQLTLPYPTDDLPSVTCSNASNRYSFMGNGDHRCGFDAKGYTAIKPMGTA